MTSWIVRSNFKVCEAFRVNCNARRSTRVFARRRFHSCVSRIATVARSCAIWRLGFNAGSRVRVLSYSRFSNDRRRAGEIRLQRAASSFPNARCSRSVIRLSGCRGLVSSVASPSGFTFTRNCIIIPSAGIKKLLAGAADKGGSLRRRSAGEANEITLARWNDYFLISRRQLGYYSIHHAEPRRRNPTAGR